METNPNVEPDAPLPPDEDLPQATPTDNTAPEPAAASDPEIAAGEAMVEAIPEPMVELAAEEPSQPDQPEGVPGENVESQREEGIQGTAVSASPEETTFTPEQEVTESHPEGEFQSEAPVVSDATDVTAQPEGDQPESVQPQGEAVQEAAAPEQGAAAEGEQDPLNMLASQAQRARLSPADEERATTLLKEALMDGRAGVIRAISALPKLPWVIGVNAVTAVWPELKPVFRSQMLAGLVKTEGDAAKRMRLSLARALFKQDVPIALKIVVGASKEMRDRDTGAMSPKHAQIFANVLIGRAKPWIAQLPLAEMKPADADIVVNCALLSAFALPHAPITQLGIIKWVAEAGRLDRLRQPVIDAAQKSLSRWSGKWQNALRKEVADLPEEFAAALKAPPSRESSKPTAGGASEESAGAATEEHPSSTEATIDSTAIAPEPDSEAEAAEVTAERHGAPEEDADAEPAETSRQDVTSEQGRGGHKGEQGQAKPRPVYESRTVPRKPQQEQQGQPERQQERQQERPQERQTPSPQGGKGGAAHKEAGVPELLRQLDSQFQSLRTELNATQNKLRQRDEDLRRAQKKAPERERASVPIIEGEPTPDELARLNRQLESRNQELQARIEELLADSEARAVSVGAVSGEPVNDPNAQLRTLLGLKLQEDFEDFLALEKESPEIVVQQHYRTVLRHVFDVITHEGVQFDVPPQEVLH